MIDAPLCAVPDCGRPVGDDGLLCGEHTSGLRRALGDVTSTVDGLDRLGRQPWERPDSVRGQITADLDLAETRQTRIGSGTGGRRSAASRTVFDERAADAHARLRHALRTWCWALAGEGDEPPADPPAMAAWLLSRLNQLRHHDAAANAHAEITGAVEHARHVIDRPRPSTFLGACECGATLLARPNASVVTCRDCGTAYNVAQLQAWLLDRAGDQLLTAAEIARAMSTLGEHIDVDRIYQWDKRGRLVEHGQRGASRLYRLSDVRDLLADALQREARTATRRAQSAVQRSA
jgi:hypothetical protein